MSLEQVYDSEISPLVLQIIEICKQNNLPFFMEFDLDGDMSCKSSSVPTENNMVRMHDVVSQCLENNNSFNLDKFLFWIVREAQQKGHSSVFLSRLDIPLEPKKEGVKGD